MLLEAAPVYDPVIFVQYGVLGVILVMMLTGWLWPKPAIEEMRKQMEQERKLVMDTLLPALVNISKNLEDATGAMKDATGAMKINTNELSEVIRILEDRK